MILVKINRDSLKRIQSFTVSGHAHYAEHGKDIICAAVSAVTFGTVNSLHDLVAKDLQVNKGEDGYLSCEIPNTLTDEKSKEAQLLLESMIIMLKQIKIAYGKKYIEILEM